MGLVEEHYDLVTFLEAGDTRTDDFTVPAPSEPGMMDCLLATVYLPCYEGL